MAKDVYYPLIPVGSADWNGGKAPPFPGAHTGTATIMMKDGKQFVVAHDAAEVRRKMDNHATAQTNPPWVAFDQPLTPIPIVLDISLIQSVI